MNRDLGDKLLRSAKNGEIEKLIEILNENSNIVNYTNRVVFIFF